MTPPVVVNVKREVCDVYIGRGSPLGNNYRVGRDGTREEVIAKYEVWLDERIEKGEISVKYLASLWGKKIGCHCKPLPCHGDVVRDRVIRTMEALECKSRTQVA